MPSPLPNDPAGRRVNNTRDLANTDIVPEDDGTSMTVATAFPQHRLEKNTVLDHYHDNRFGYGDASAQYQTPAGSRLQQPVLRSGSMLSQ